ncbi:ABC transporter substrate-binding protein [Humibacter albus]|uniref:ABC transporter substrate-binding protein n=1 Tax=Humibacter albus TaxID=427754 RepID=UPI0003B36AD6|nr:extracellular solute-binding protein [Humibacter albus]
MHQRETPALSRRSFLLAGGAVATTLVLSGCGTRLQSSAGSTVSKTPLVYWGKWASGTPQAKLFNTIIKDYEAKTGQKVDVQWIGNNEETQVKNAIATGSGPDIYDSSIDHTAEFRAAGALGDMSAIFDTEIPGEGKTIKQVLPKSVLKAISDKKGYGFVPHTVFSEGLWYDAAVDSDFATNPPATFDDFLAHAADLKKSTGKQPIALDGTVDSYNAFWIFQLMLATGGAGTLASLSTSASAWDAPAVRKAAVELQKLVAADLFEPDYMATKYPDAQNAWASGQHLYNLNGTWLASETAASKSATQKPRVMAFPPVKAGKSSVVTVGALGWAANAKSKKQSQIAEFLAFAMQKKYDDRIATDAGNIPARSDSPAPVALKGIKKSIDTTTTISLDFDGVATSAPQWWNDVFMPLDDKLIGGSLSVDDFLAQGKAQTAALLNK